MLLRERLGQVIKDKRKGKFSQEELANAANIHRTTMSEIERGVSNISVDITQRIAQALGLKLSELFAAVEKDRH